LLVASVSSLFCQEESGIDDWIGGEQRKKSKNGSSKLISSRLETKLGEEERKGRERIAKLLLPRGAGAHLTGDQEMGMEREGYAGGVWDAGPL
jgi:hypothetical protein